ncbi:MAG: nucleotidyltransferase domain-containing protein [Bacteroidales bacterium]|nr:nucleotidyltransferase domain-containing protein [Bacteroidales bacterium]
MIHSKQILNYLASHKERYINEYHLTKIGIFGSIARDEQNKNSDLDIIVEFKKDTPDLYTIKQKLKNELQSQFNVSVDICREKYIKPIFRNQILSEAKYV